MAPPPPPLDDPTVDAGVTVNDVVLLAVAPALSVTTSCTVTLPPATALSVALAVFVAPEKLALDEPDKIVHW